MNIPVDKLRPLRRRCLVSPIIRSFVASGRCPGRTRSLAKVSRKARDPWHAAAARLSTPMDYSLPCREGLKPRGHRPRSAVPAPQPSQHSRFPLWSGRVLSAVPKIGELAPLEEVNLDTTGAQGTRWLPAVRSSPHVCVLGVQSPNLLARGSYGRVTAELQALWALAHGMEYRLVTCDLTGGWGMERWNKPRALLAALGGATSAAPRRPGNRTQAGVSAAWQQAPACDWVFMIDADAAVRTLSVTLQHLLGLARVCPKARVYLTPQP